MDDNGGIGQWLLGEEVWCFVHDDVTGSVTAPAGRKPGPDSFAEFLPTELSLDQGEAYVLPPVDPQHRGPLFHEMMEWLAELRFEAAPGAVKRPGQQPSGAVRPSKKARESGGSKRKGAPAGVMEVASKKPAVVRGSGPKLLHADIKPEALRGIFGEQEACPAEGRCKNPTMGCPKSGCAGRLTSWSVDQTAVSAFFCTLIMTHRPIRSKCPRCNRQVGLTTADLLVWPIRGFEHLAAVIV